MSAAHPRTVAVIGGGIAGLVAGREIARRARADGSDLAVTLYESSPRLGGKIRTQAASDGARLEFGPDSFLAAKPAAAALAGELGLELVAPGPMASRVYLVADGRLRALPRGLAMGIPTGIAPMLGAVASGLISPLGAVRAAIEPLLPRSVGRGREGDAEPSVGYLTRARLGRGVSDRLVAPLLSGVFGAPPDRIGAASAFPHLMEQRSLVLAMARRASGAPQGPTFLAPRDGMSSLVTALTEELVAAGVAMRTSCEIDALHPERDGYRISTGDGGDEGAFDAVVVAVPPPTAANLLSTCAPVASEYLDGIEMSSSAVVFLRYEQGSLGRPLDASGLLVAPGEPATIAAATFLPSKWPHAGWNDPWIRAFVTNPAFLPASDDDLAAGAVNDLAAVLEPARTPIETIVHRWPEAVPIQGPGHRERVAAALESMPIGLALAGSAYLGSGVPDAVSSGSVAASRVLSGGKQGL